MPTEHSQQLQMIDLGDAMSETRQVWLGSLPDSYFGLGIVRD